MKKFITLSLCLTVFMANPGFSMDVGEDDSSKSTHRIQPNNQQMDDEAWSLYATGGLIGVISLVCAFVCDKICSASVEDIENWLASTIDAIPDPQSAAVIDEAYLNQL
jgi:hypothetical protein